MLSRQWFLGFISFVCLSTSSAIAQSPPIMGPQNNPQSNAPGLPGVDSAPNPLQSCAAPQDLSAYEQRLSAYHEALEQSPNSPEHLYQQGRIQARLQQWEEAGKSFREALAASDGEKTLESQIYHELGNLYACQQQFDKAVDEYKKSLRSDSQNQDAQHNLALTRLLAQQQEQQQQEQQQGEGENSENKESEGEQQEQQDGSNEQQDGSNEQKEGEESSEQQNASNEQQDGPNEKQEEGQQSEDGQSAEEEQTAQNQGEQAEEEQTAQSQGGNEPSDETDESTQQLELNQQQAEQLLNRVPENRRNFIQRLLKRQPPSQPTEKDW